MIKSKQEETGMKTFVMVTRLAPEHMDPVDVANTMKDRANGGALWQEEIKKKCPQVNFLAHYEETAARVSLITRGNGAFTVESWPAIPTYRLADFASDI
jgi:hypothetical protein